MGGEQMSQIYLQELENEIAELFGKNKKNNSYIEKLFLFF